MVYYRKYRPQTIDELDSENLRNTLNNVFLGNLHKDKKGILTFQDTIPHAFLFTGPKGLGKTSTARIMAKVINCVELKIDGKRIILCDNHCEPCRSITSGNNLDVLEIDGASNRGIDEIRDLRDKVRLAPVSNHKKIYIIDEVHMLTTEAFNALLKTIEEPPPHVIFIFCTTEGHKVPATIMSRCFNVSLTLATIEELIRSFHRIVKDEKLKVEEDVLREIANMADGSFRDGVKLLEELVLASEGKEITTKLIEERFHTSSISEYVSEMINALSNRDIKKAIQLVITLTDLGIDTKYFIQRLLESLHMLVLIKLNINQSSKKHPELTIKDIKLLVELLSRAFNEIKYAAVEQLPLELVIIEWCSSALSMQPTKVDNELQATAYVQSRTLVHDTNAEHSRERIVLAGNPLKVDGLMDMLITKTKVLNQSLAGILRGCHIKQFDGEQLILEAHYKFHKEKLDEAKSKEMLKRVSEEIAGKQVTVSVLLRERSS